MKMVVRNFNKLKDLEILNSICIDRNLSTIDPEMLSDFGFIVSNIAFGWLYPTLTSNLCIIENVIVNKNFEYELRNEALNMLFKQLHSTAKTLGCKYIKNSVGNASMKNRLEKLGYTKIETNVNTYLGVISCLG